MSFTCYASQFDKATLLFVRNARACGKELGRPRRIVNQDELIRLKAQGASLRQIAQTLGIGYGTVRTRLRQVS